MNDTFILNVNKLYRSKTYLEKYGHSVFITTIIVLAFLLVFSYFYIKANLEPLRRDWNNVKCHPGIIPFAGFINKDPNDSIFESTGKNFSLCTNLILKTVVDVFTRPVTGLVNGLNKTFQKILSSGGALQNLVAKAFEQVQKYMAYILSRIGAVLIPIQKLFVNIKDTLKKMNGVLSSLLFTLIAQFYALKSYIGAFMDVIIVSMIGSSAAIVALWLIPFSWPIAIPATVFYVVIMTLMIIIKVYMSKILLISSGQIPSKPGKPANCFHKDTIINTANGEIKISELNPGDELLDGDVVTGIFVTDGTKNVFYNLDGTIVTGNHHVYNPEIGWNRVENDPRSILLKDMEQEVVYCLNTQSKKILIGKQTFMDWDEVDITDILILKNKKYIYTKEDINYYLNSGFFKDTLIETGDGEIAIQDIKVGEKLKNNITVTGIVKSLDHKNTFNYFNEKLNIKGNNVLFDVDNLANYNKSYMKNSKYNGFLYHIITDEKYFFLKDTKVFDYNACLEYFLNN